MIRASFGGQPVPGRMDDADEGAGRAPGQRDDVLALAGRREIDRQADGEQVPQFIGQRPRDVKLGADKSGEIGSAKRGCVGHRQP